MLLLLDAYHLGDPLFVTGFARDLAARDGGRGAVLVHGSAERGERALEALGVMPTGSDGVWQVSDDEQAAAVERATRDLNREIAHELNEAGVASIRVIGADRGLLKLEGNSVIASNPSWLRTLVTQGVVAVVASLVSGGEGSALCEVDPAAAAAALADALGESVTVLLRSAAPADEPSVSLAASQERFGDPRSVARLRSMGAETQAVTRASIRNGPQNAIKQVVE